MLPPTGAEHEPISHKRSMLQSGSHLSAAGKIFQNWDATPKIRCPTHCRRRVVRSARCCLIIGFFFILFCPSRCFFDCLSFYYIFCNCTMPFAHAVFQSRPQNPIIPTAQLADPANEPRNGLQLFTNESETRTKLPQV